MPATATAMITVSQAAAALKECCSGASAQMQKQVNAIKGLPGQQQLLLCTLAIARGDAIARPAASMQPSLQTPKPISSIFAARTPLAKMSTPLQSKASAPKPFGLSTTPCTQKCVSRAFPMADTEILATPSSCPPTTPKTPATPAAAARKSSMPLPLVYTKYKAAAREAGFALVDMSQLQEMVSALQESGLLESKGALVKRGEKLVSLAVGTADVKHALAESRMLQPLIQKLP